jgi:Na+/H+-dicarboxylate symporter
VPDWVGLYLAAGVVFTAFVVARVGVRESLSRLRDLHLLYVLAMAAHLALWPLMLFGYCWNRLWGVFR